MRRRILGIPAATLLALLTALAPATARPTDVSGFIGGEGTRSDAWDPRGNSMQLKLAGGLTASGDLAGPEVFNWRADAGYGQDHGYQQGTSANKSTLTYGARAGLFDARGSLLTLRGSASRSQIEFTQSGTTQFIPGTTTTDSYGAEVLTGGGDRPRLQLSGDLQKYDTSSLDAPDVRRTTRGLAANLTHGNDTYSYMLGYRARFDEGSYASANSDDQTISAIARTRLTDATEANVSAQYYKRTPQNSDPTNPMYDDAQVGLQTQSTFRGSILRTNYGFGHTAVTATGIPSTEHTGNALSVTNDRVIAPEWTLLPTVSLAFSQDRIGTDESRAASQAGGASLRWTRTRLEQTYTLEGGGSAGVIEPAGAPAQATWSATGTGRYARTTVSGGWGAGYLFSYDTNANAELGWSVNQSIDANASMRVSDTRTLTGNLLVNSRRARTPLGDGAGRTAILNAALTGSTTTFGLSASMVDGLSATLANPIRSDGLFLPPSFNTHSQSVLLYVSASLPPHLVTGASVRLGTTSGPDFGNRRQFGATGHLGYYIGQFMLLINDTYTAEGPNFDLRFNQVIVSFARSFRL
jgi:hypothetical protein